MRAGCHRAKELMTSITHTPDRGSTLRFLWQFVRNPRSTGAVTPSGPTLCAKMAAGLGPATEGVLELGGGTGVVSRALLATGMRPDALTVLETNPDFVRRLTASLEGARVVNHSAFEIENLPDDGRMLDAVVSGLPLVNMTPAQHAAILRGAFSRLKPHGFVRQFTYRPVCPVSADVLHGLGLTARYEGMALRNLPPAFVYRIERKR